MDDKGRIKIFWWYINIIDFFVLVFILCLMPAFYFGYKIVTKSQVVEPALTHYPISRACPNCGRNKVKKIPLGELTPLEWTGICGKEIDREVIEGCQNEVVFIAKPKPKLPEPPKEISYEQLYYKRLLKERGWLE